MENDSNINIKDQVMLNIILIVICLMLAAAAYIAESMTSPDIGSGLIPLGSGWTRAGEEEASLEKLDIGDNTLIRCTKICTEEELSEKSFCLKSKHVFFKLYLNGELIYDFHPKPVILCGKSYGTRIHTIFIPEFSGTAELMIEADPIYSDNTVYFNNIYAGDSGVYIKNFLAVNLIKLAISFMMAVLGIVLITISLGLSKLVKGILSPLTALGAFSVLAGIWTGTETSVLQMITERSASLHLMNYLALMSMPYPAVTFTAGITGSADSRLVKAAKAAVLSNVVLNLTLSVLGIADYHELIAITHIVLFLSISAAVYIIVRSYIKKREDKSVYYMIGGSFMVIIVTGVTDLIRYRFSHGNNDAGLFLRFGLLTFIFLMGVFTLREIIFLTKMGKKAEVMRDLAYRDVLTGMYNRTAFTEHEKKVRAYGEAGKVCFVQFDINDLKKANDVYGHGEGDRQIIAGASAITDSFGRIGKCYRTGGDEFIAILDCPINSPKIIEAEKILTESVEEYNERMQPPVRLCIAYGIAQYNGRSTESAEKEADEKMYQMKKRLKKAKAAAK